MSRYSDNQRYNKHYHGNKQYGQCYHDNERDEQRYHDNHRDDQHSAYNDSDSVPECDFNFIEYKRDFNKIFFSDQHSPLNRNSDDYANFWAFITNYQGFQRRKMTNSRGETTEKMTEESGRLSLPQTFDNSYRMNITLDIKNVHFFMEKGRLIDYHAHPAVTPLRVKQFANILIHYLDFLNSQKFNKLKKIKDDQEKLPIFEYRQDILDTLCSHRVMVIAGDTGCGKSTQVPQYLLKAKYTNIACTQPRRLACVSLANRVGYETLNEFGSEVAYKIRFEGTKTPATRILFLTEGLLLRQMSTDPLLSQYSVIVIDEVHERHMQTDFLLGVLKCLLVERSDLKLILMSATINIHLFSHYFDDCPVVKVPGRLYPIEVEYCPIEKAEISSRSERLDPSPYLTVLQRIDAKYPRSERGDVLIFLSGIQEIITVVDAVTLYAQKTKRWIVLPLHSTLAITEQDKVFDIPPEGVRKCIVSTNIAETSVTINGVRFIIDSGKVKEMSLDPKYKLQKLKEFWISQASAEQRKGRAGRTGPGVCFRLYSEKEFSEFQEYSTPEIQRILIDSILLQLMSLGLSDPRRFPYIESPSGDNIENSITFLKEQNVLSSDETLLPIGRMLSWLPVNVYIGKILIMGALFDMLEPVLTIAAVLSVQFPFTGHLHTTHDVLTRRKSLFSEHGDPFMLLNAYDAWIREKSEGNNTRKWCKRMGLEEQRLYEMTKLKTQFQNIIQDHHLIDDKESQPSYSSHERRKRHGQRKRLRDLKREHRQESRKTKVLKMNADDIVLSDDEAETENSIEKDIKDLEFRLTNDLNKLQEISNKTRNFNLHDINLLKIIICSGLYPQVAIADDNNSLRPDAEQVFHTKRKPFLILHPTCVFTNQSDLLHPKKSAKEYPNAPLDLQGKLSNKHELLAFVTLLETNKPYIVNAMRVPALQTAILFSNSIDTNTTCTRLVCDDWLEFRLIDSESGQKTLSSVVQLRKAWQQLLEMRLQDVKSRESTWRLEEQLTEKLSAFLAMSDIVYSMRRLLNTELDHIYMGPQADGSKTSTNSLFKMQTRSQHPIKGGIQFNSYLTLNCLHSDDVESAWGNSSAHLQQHWLCPTCHENLIVSFVERLNHEKTCTQKPNEDLPDHGDSVAVDNPHKRSYFCPECETQYIFTTTELLKHKRTHSQQSP